MTRRLGGAFLGQQLTATPSATADLTLESLILRAMIIREMEPYAFHCPKLDCKAQYVAGPKDLAPATRLRSATHRLASIKGQFIHYQLVRFD